MGETVSFASLVVLSFQYLSRKKKTRNGGWREGNDPFAATNKKKTATNNKRQKRGEIERERERATFFCYCYRLRDITMMHVCSRFSDCVYL